MKKLSILGVLRFVRRAACVAVFAGLSSAVVATEPVVPGTGTKVVQVSDDFEDESWEFVHNHPKSTEDIDKQQRYPAGESKNGRWYEGMKRGQPDVIRRVETPPNGLPGSRGALLLKSLQTGIPGRPSFTMHQDDFICDVNYRLGGSVPVHQSPNVVTRVFFPPVAQWEKRTGPHFAFRMALDTTVTKRSRGLFASSKTEREVYWPGMFIEFESKSDGYPHDYAHIRVRADEYGNDYKSKQITVTGWWTLGLSVTPDGSVHYYAKPGLDDLTAEDRIASGFPYGFKAERFRTFFYNVCNGDDNKTWSTSFVIDDPTMYYIPR